jgi:hypothetical protein
MRTISCFLMGGLGNQLFQIFATIAYCIEHNFSFVFPHSETLNVGITRPTYWNSLFKNMTMFTTMNPNIKYTNQLLANFHRLHEKGFRYNKLPELSESYPKDIMLFGYFQSYKYFCSFEQHIYSLIGISDYRSSIKTEFADLFQDRTTISMHFRLGDYKTKQQYHPIMSYEYYNNAFNYILSKNKTHLHPIRVLYFCEKEDNAYVNDMIDRMHESNQTIEFIKVDDTICDWKQMLIMSACDNNIIANSSFSWWGAYLNPSTSKIVCYPTTWFGPDAKNNNTEDLCPKSWIRI